MFLIHDDVHKSMPGPPSQYQVFCRRDYAHGSWVCGPILGAVTNFVGAIMPMDFGSVDQSCRRDYAHGFWLCGPIV